MPSAQGVAGFLDGRGDPEAVDARHRLDRRCGRPSPSSTNSGSTKSPAESVVSRTRSRSAPVRRRRRRRVCGKAMPSEG